MNNIENYTIRNEQSKDHWNVEDLTRKALWNLNVLYSQSFKNILKAMGYKLYL